MNSLKNIIWWINGLKPVSLFRIASYLFINENNKPTRSPKKTKIFYGVFTETFFNTKIFGGKVKLTLLKKHFRNNLNNWNILYLVSSALPDGWIWSIFWTKILGKKVVINQNGVDYPGLHPCGWRISNYPRLYLLKSADYIFYQSTFCKDTVKQYVGKIETENQILYNPVDLRKVKYKASMPNNNERWHIFLGGNQYQQYRVRCAVDVLATLLQMSVACDLYISGRLSWASSEEASQKELQTWAEEQNCYQNIFLTGVYQQTQMSKLFSSMHILLHTKNYDPCPTLVIEAMAHGLPIAYVKNGGLPEIVGEKAGIGVTPQISSMLFEKGPEASQLAKAIIKIINKWSQYSKNAATRSRKYDLPNWLNKQNKAFETLLNEDK
jgi:glycosyltransferase involved in cell wall biosynthesis